MGPRASARRSGVRAIVLIAIVLASSGSVAARAATTKVISGGSFVSVWRGKSAVECKNTYSIQYGVSVLACVNARGQVALLGPYAKGSLLAHEDGTLKFPETARGMYPGDTWTGGKLLCRVLSYGRVHCFSGSSGYGFTVGRTFTELT